MEKKAYRIFDQFFGIRYFLGRIWGDFLRIFGGVLDGFCYSFGFFPTVSVVVVRFSSVTSFSPSLPLLLLRLPLSDLFRARALHPIGDQYSRQLL